MDDKNLSQAISQKSKESRIPFKKLIDKNLPASVFISYKHKESCEVQDEQNDGIAESDFPNSFVQSLNFFVESLTQMKPVWIPTAGTVQRLVLKEEMKEWLSTCLKICTEWYITYGLSCMHTV